MIRVFVFTHFESARCLGSKLVHDFVPPVLSPCGLLLPDVTPTLYKCNRAANAIALNPLLLLQKIVPKILKCRNFRGNQSEREGSACHADKNEFTQMPTGLWKSNHSSRRSHQGLSWSTPARHALFFNSQAHSDKGEMTGAVEGNTYITSNEIPSSSPTVVSIGWQETCALLQVVRSE